MRRRPVAILAAALAAAAAGSGCAPGNDDRPKGGEAAAAPPADFLGVVAEDVFAGDARYRRRHLALQRDAGVRLIRQTFDWSLIERRRGAYDLRRHDRYVAALASKRMRLLAILFHPPRFRSSAPRRGAKRGTYPPRRPGDLGRFAAVLIRRYGPSGSLWRERPDLPRTPIGAWQVWNEPNLPVYWPSGPDPAEYTALLKATARAIRRADPGAEVVTAGLPESRLGMPFREFVSRMLAAGAAEHFDALAIHPFGVDARATITAVEGARALLDAGHAAGKRLWVTEVGWATGGRRSPFTAGPEGQAERIERTIVELGRRREQLGLRGLVYFNWRDATPYPGTDDFWGLHTGLLSLRGAVKPGFSAFKRASARLENQDALPQTEAGSRVAG